VGVGEECRWCLCSTVRSADVFKAARCGLGGVGVITGVVLQCSPLTTLRSCCTSKSLSQALTGVEGRARESEYFRMEWIPGPGTPHSPLALALYDPPVECRHRERDQLD
jgi:hypothetical protein